MSNALPLGTPAPDSPLPAPPDQAAPLSVFRGQSVINGRCCEGGLDADSLLMTLQEATQ